MTADDDQLYTVDGSRVWLSPSARELAAQYFGPGRQGERQMAQYLRLRHTMQQAALSPSNIGTDALAPWLTAPSGGLPQEYEGTTGDAQQEEQGPPPDVALPDVLPTYRPLD